MVLGHQFHHLRGHRILVGQFAHVDIDAAFLLADGRARDRIGADDGKDMAGSVHAHQLVAALPVDMQNQLFADRRQGLSFKRHMDDDVLGGAGFRRAEQDARAVLTLQKAAIPRLAAGGGVKTGLV